MRKDFTSGPNPTLGSRLDEELRMERKWRETAVAFGRALEVILANLDSGILLLDGIGRVLYSNQALANLFDLPLERISRMMRDQFFREISELCEDPGSFMEKMRLVGSSTSVVREEFEMQQPKWIRIGCLAKPVALPSGHGQLIVFTNISADVDVAADRERLALVDGLTGLPNRRAGEQAVVREAARAERTDSPLSFALFDIDFFKRINDTYGHAGGDRVLQEVGRLMGRFLRKGDIAARWGGEEFLTILVDVDHAGAVALAERFRKAVEALKIEGLGPVTISAGVSQLRIGEVPSAAVARADEKLYESKARGRNCVS